MTSFDYAEGWDPSLDAVAVSPANHRVIFEDDDIRILAIVLNPRDPEPLHHHRWPSVFVIHQMAPIRDFDAAGREQSPPQCILDAVAEGQFPLVIRMPPQPLHSVENVGDQPIQGTRIEFKRAAVFRAA